MAKRPRIPNTLAVIADMRATPGVYVNRTRRADRLRFLLKMADVEILEEIEAPNARGPIAFVLAASTQAQIDTALYGESGVTYSFREPKP